MARKIDYASMFTLRKDGRYQGSYTDETGRHFIYDRDPERLYKKLQAAQIPEEEKQISFREIAENWERQHREEITSRTWINYEPHYKDILEKHGDKPIDEVTAQQIVNHLTAAKAKGYSATVLFVLPQFPALLIHIISFHSLLKQNTSVVPA